MEPVRMPDGTWAVFDGHGNSLDVGVALLRNRRANMQASEIKELRHRDRAKWPGFARCWCEVC